MTRKKQTSYRNLFEYLELHQNHQNSKTRIIRNIKNEYENNHKNEFSDYISELDSKTNKCPCCNSELIIKYGKTKNNTQRYKCRICSKVFNKANNSLFFSSKVNYNAWQSFLEGLLSEMSIKAACIKAKIAYPTGKYWVNKIFSSLNDYQDNIKISGNVYIDETYISVEKSKIAKNKNLKLRGLSKNQICILIAKSENGLFVKSCGFGKPTTKKIFENLSNHILKNSNLFHDGDYSHYKLIKALELNDYWFKAKLPNGKTNEEALEKLKTINDECRNLKFFLSKHKGLDKTKLDNYLNLYSFISNQKLFEADLCEITKNLLKRMFFKDIKVKYP